MTPTELGTWNKDTGVLTVTTLPDNTEWLLKRCEATTTTTLKPYKLSLIDDIRDSIYATKGNVTFKVNNTKDNNALYRILTDKNPVNRFNTVAPQFGLAVKTYNSDLFQNWINSEWIDSVNGINEITAVDVSGGSLSMDALNLSQKVYNMLNRIAVSGGTYKDWLETVYTGGHYMERCETPMFEEFVS